MADHWLASSLAACMDGPAQVQRKAVAFSPGWTGIWKVVAISVSACGHALAHWANRRRLCKPSVVPAGGVRVQATWRARTVADPRRGVQDRAQHQAVVVRPVVVG